MLNYIRMSAYTPPTENVPIFDAALFRSGEDTLTQDEADKRYLRFPIAQGAETLQSISIIGSVAQNTGEVGSCQYGDSNSLKNATGTGNTCIGKSIGTTITTGNNNTLLGSAGTGNSITTGSANNCIGGSSGSGITTGSNNIFLGNLSGQQISTGSNNIAVGFSSMTGFGAGVNNASNIIAIGTSAGSNQISSDNIYIGNNAGNSTSISGGTAGIGIGLNAGRQNQNAGAVALGSGAGQTTQGVSAIAIGLSAGNATQSGNAVAVGNQAGQTTQGSASVAIGQQAGQTTQGIDCVAVGRVAGSTSQAQGAVAIGVGAGQATQGIKSVAVGFTAGFNSQGTQAVAVGLEAGNANQGANSVAVGYRAGKGVVAGQGASSICIGDSAGVDVCGAGEIIISSAPQNGNGSNSIIINASGTGIVGSGNNKCFITPIQNISGTTVLQYNATTNEVSHSSTLPNITTPLTITGGNEIINMGADPVIANGFRFRNSSGLSLLESRIGGVGAIYKMRGRVSNTPAADTYNIIEAGITTTDTLDYINFGNPTIPVNITTNGTELKTSPSGGEAAPLLTLNTTDAAALGAFIKIDKTSVSPDPDDVIGGIIFTNNDTLGVEQTFAKIYSRAVITTAGVTRGKMGFSAYQGTSEIEFMGYNANTNNLNIAPTASMNTFFGLSGSMNIYYGGTTPSSGASGSVIVSSGSRVDTQRTTGTGSAYKLRIGSAINPSSDNNNILDAGITTANTQNYLNIGSSAIPSNTTNNGELYTLGTGNINCGGSQGYLIGAGEFPIIDLPLSNGEAIRFSNFDPTMRPLTTQVYNSGDMIGSAFYLPKGVVIRRVSMYLHAATSAQASAFIYRQDGTQISSGTVSAFGGAANTVVNRSFTANVVIADTDLYFVGWRISTANINIGSTNNYFDILQTATANTFNLRAMTLTSTIVNPLVGTPTNSTQIPWINIS